MNNLFFIFILCAINVYCQAKNGFLLMPDNKVFPSLKANPFEARIGLQFYPSTGFFRIEAGHEINVLNYEQNNIIFSFSPTFFIHGLGLNIKEKRLPIDVADGYFGFSLALADTNNMKLRLRILHNSAHLIDGHYERYNKFESINYSKDFIELIISKIFNSFTLYSGINYSLVIHPKSLGRYGFLAGTQFYFDIGNNFLGNKILLFSSYNFSITSIPSYIGNNNVMIGIQFGDNKKKLLTIFISYYSGGNLFNQYYYKKEKQFSFGFNLE